MAKPSIRAYRQPTSFRLTPECKRRIRTVAEQLRKTETQAIEDIFLEIELLNRRGQAPRYSILWLPVFQNTKR